MQVTQVDVKTFKVVLNKAELDDLKHEADYSELTRLDIMKAIFLMTFVQIMSCRYFRRMLGQCHKEKPKDKEPMGDMRFEPGG